MRAHQAGAAAVAARCRRLHAEQADEVRRRCQPAAVGVEMLLEVCHRAPHAVRQRLAGIAHVVEPRAVPLLRHHLAQQLRQQPGDRLVLGHAVALDRHPVEHGKADAVGQLAADRRHDLCATGQREPIGTQAGDRGLVGAHGLRDLVEFRPAAFRAARSASRLAPDRRAASALARSLLHPSVNVRWRPMEQIPCVSHPPGDCADALAQPHRTTCQTARGRQGPEPPLAMAEFCRESQPTVDSAPTCRTVRRIRWHHP